MIFNMVGNGSQGIIAGSGNGNGLNFKIVGGDTFPTNPEENTLWVETEIEFDSWAIGYEQPEKVENKIWIQDLAADDLNFNILEYNGIVLNPAYCWQCINNSWVQKKAYVYKNSTWIRLKRSPIYLYNNGDQCESITGGWGSWTSSSTNTHCEVNFYSDRITLSAGYDNKGYTHAAAYTENKIDFDGYNTMTIRVQTGYPRFTITIGNNTIFSHEGYNPEPRNFTIDVSKYSGKYQVELLCSSCWDDIQTGGGYTIYSVKLS